MDGAGQSRWLVSKFEADCYNTWGSHAREARRDAASTAAWVISKLTGTKIMIGTKLIYQFLDVPACFKDALQIIQAAKQAEIVKDAIQQLKTVIKEAAFGGHKGALFNYGTTCVKPDEEPKYFIAPDYLTPSFKFSWEDNQWTRNKEVVNWCSKNGNIDVMYRYNDNAYESTYPQNYHGDWIQQMSGILVII